MNFKNQYSQLELDKSQSEIMLENKINDLFNFVVLEAEMLIEYYCQILEPYLISLNFNLNVFELQTHKLV